MTDLLTTAEVAAMLRTAPGTLRYWRHQGIGPHGFRAGRKVLYRRAAVEAWLSEREAATQVGAR